MFWTCVDLWEGSKAPALLRGVVVKQRLDLQVLHGGGGHSTRWRQRRVAMATSNRSQKSCGDRVEKRSINIEVMNCNVFNAYNTF